MWTLDEAVVLIQDLAPKVRAVDYHVMLGGSVLHSGKSEDDLDLFFAPLNHTEGNKQKLRKVLWDYFNGFLPIRDTPDYQQEEVWNEEQGKMVLNCLWHWQDMDKADLGGARVDLFILK